MNTRADRVAVALQLRDDLKKMHRTPGDSPATAPAPIGDCGRDAAAECGMKDESECRTHCGPADGDPATLNYSGTLQQRRAALKLAWRYGLR